MPPLPTSLSPHVCIQSSPDLEDLLTASSLPPLPQILQSFSPLPQGMLFHHFGLFFLTQLVYGSSYNAHYFLNSCPAHLLYAPFLRPRRNRSRMSGRRRGTRCAHDRLDQCPY